MKILSKTDFVLSVWAHVSALDVCAMKK